MAEPYDIKSPEEIAKVYGGNKQQIAQAMQMGVVDPTAGVLAGMFIDRMRSAQMQEQAPQQTVAQQVMGGAPAAPAMPPAPSSPPAGLGATPQAAPPMAPQGPPMPAAQPPMGMAGGGDVDKYRLIPNPEHERFRAEDIPAPSFEDIMRQITGGGIHKRIGKGEVHARYNPLDRRSEYGAQVPLDDRTDLFASAGNYRGVIPNQGSIGIRHRFADGGTVPPYAAGGGLSDLPVPDTIFDEPSNGGFDDGYAPGGLVAFADGGSTDDDFEAFKRAIIAQESGGNYAAYNPESGASGLVQFMPDTARRLATRMGMDYNPAMLRSNAPAAKQYQDRLANAQLRDAWNYGGGDPAKAAAYHFAGPDTSGWKSKTRQYQSDILQRMGKTPGASGSGDSGEATRASYSKDLEAMAKRFAPNEAPRDTYIAQLSKLMSPETKAAESKQAVSAAIGDFARALGSTPGSLLMGITAGLSSAATGAAERKAAEKNKLLALSKEIADQYDLRQKAVFESLKDANSVVKDMYQAGASTDRIDAYLQKAQIAADTAGRKGEATQAARQASTLRKQALDYQNKALAADKEMAAAASAMGAALDPNAAKKQADKVAALIHAMSLANNQLKQMGDPGITWDPKAFTNYNAFARQQRSWFHAPEQGDQQAAPTGQPAPQSGNSALFSQADAILGAQ